MDFIGRVAQLVERYPDTIEVVGSNPTSSTNFKKGDPMFGNDYARKWSRSSTNTSALAAIIGILIWLFFAALSLAVPGTIIYIIIHFAKKYW